MKKKRWREKLMEQRAGNRAAAEFRARLLRWNVGAAARVTSPTYGETVVPHQSRFAAIQCAAEVWGVPWTKIGPIEIQGTDETPVRMP